MNHPGLLYLQPELILRVTLPPEPSSYLLTEPVRFEENSPAQQVDPKTVANVSPASQIEACGRYITQPGWILLQRSTDTNYLPGGGVRASEWLRKPSLKQTKLKPPSGRGQLFDT